MPHTTRSLLIASLLAAGCAALSPRQTAELYHGFPVGQRILSPGLEDVAISVGATAEIDFFAPPERLHGGSGWVDADEVEGVEIRSAVSSKPDVVRVLGTQAGRVTLEGVRMGWSELVLETSRGHAELTVHVAEPAHVELAHEAVDVTPGAPRVFVTGGTARFRMVQRDAAGRLLGGWGSMLPVRADPPGSASVARREGDVELVDVTVEAEGRITLRPLGGSPVTLDAGPLGEGATFGVDALTAPPRTEPLTAIRSGEPNLVVLWVRRADGARVFGIIERARLVSLTPDTCDVERMERFYSEGVYSVTAIAPGECSLEAYLDDQSTTLSVPVE